MNLPFKKSVFLELLRYPLFSEFARAYALIYIPDNVESKEFVSKDLKNYKTYLDANISVVENLIDIFLDKHPVFWGIVFTINKMAAEWTLGHATSSKSIMDRQLFVGLKLDIILDLLVQAKLPEFDADKLKHRVAHIIKYKNLLSYNFKDRLMSKIADSREDTLENLYLYAISIADRFLNLSKDIFKIKLNRIMSSENILKDYFDRVVVINLDRRKDRWEAVQDKLSKINWPFKEPERFSAYDGARLPMPIGWTLGAGTWGCLLSHREVLARAMQDGLNSVLVLEDDIFFAPDFENKVLEFIKNVPADWDQLMLGGQYFDDTKVYDISPDIRKVSLCHRAHAYAVRGTFMQYMYSKLCSSYGHVDHILNTFQERFNVYTPRHFLIGQDGSPSDISGSQGSPDLLRNPPDKDTPIFVLAPNIDLHQEVVTSDLPLHFGSISESGVTQQIENFAKNPTRSLELNIHNFLISSIWYARSVYPSKYSTILNPEGLLLDTILKSKGNVNLIYIESLDQLKETIAKYPFGEDRPTQFPEQDKAA
jgi:hypothetical protein